MAAPTYVKASTGSTDAGGAWTHTCAAPAASGRLMILQVIQTVVTGTVTVSSVTNMNNLAGTANVMTTGPALTTANLKLYTFLGRSTGTSAPVVTGGNSGTDDIYIRCYEFNNCSAGTTLASVIENVSPGASLSTSGDTSTVNGCDVTTCGPNRMCLNLIGCKNDNAIGPITGMAGGTWAEIVAEYSSAVGSPDGMLSCQYANLATDGTVSGGSVVMTGATPWNWGNIGFAIVGSSEIYNYSKTGRGQEHNP